MFDFVRPSQNSAEIGQFFVAETGKKFSGRNAAHSAAAVNQISGGFVFHQFGKSSRFDVSQRDIDGPRNVSECEFIGTTHVENDDGGIRIHAALGLLS